MVGNLCKDLDQMKVTVETEIKLFASNKKGIIDIARNDISFVHIESFESSVEIGSRDNLLELIDLFKEEDSVTLGFVVGLDDPGGIWVFLELIQEDGVLIFIDGEILGKVKVMGKKSMCAFPQI